jgi:hypothetical protein
MTDTVTTSASLQFRDQKPMLHCKTDVYPIDNVEYYTFTKGTFVGCSDVILLANGLYRSGGFELTFQSSRRRSLTKIFEAGAEFDIKTTSARDTLRLKWVTSLREMTSPTKLRCRRSRFAGRPIQRLC